MASGYSQTFWFAWTVVFPRLLHRKRLLHFGEMNPLIRLRLLILKGLHDELEREIGVCHWATDKLLS
jgi:hypothetical protein